MYNRSIHNGFAPAAHGIAMDKRQVDHIQLIFDDPRVMSLPTIGFGAVNKGVIQVVKEIRGFYRFGWRYLPTISR